MYKLLPLLLITFSVLAQNSKPPEYVSLDENSVYDVEVIVFAYNKPLPNKETYTSKKPFAIDDAYRLDKLQGNYPLIKETNTVQNTSELTIPIDENNSNKEALVWFEHKADKYKLIKIWDKLQNKSSITPLIHRSWRQVETPFEEPQYIDVSTIDPINDNSHIEKIIYPDLTLKGKVSLSKGRYLHFGYKLNLFRNYQHNGENVNMVFTLTERKQMYSNELNYFDSPWFGSIVKITKVTGEESETSNNETNNSTTRP